MYPVDGEVLQFSEDPAIAEVVPHVAATALQRPLAPPTVVGDLVELRDRAGIDVRVVELLWPYVDAWMPTTLGCSAIHLALPVRLSEPRSAERAAEQIGARLGCEAWPSASGSSSRSRVWTVTTAAPR